MTRRTLAAQRREQDEADDRTFRRFLGTLSDADLGPTRDGYDKALARATDRYLRQSLTRRRALLEAEIARRGNP